MKRKKILICCILAALLTIVTIIPVFAVSQEAFITTTPEDLGQQTSGSYFQPGYDIFNKYYLVIDTTNTSSYNLIFYVYKDDGTYTYYVCGTLVINDTYVILSNNNTTYDTNGLISFPNIKYEYGNNTTIYIPIFILNGFLAFDNSYQYAVYRSTTTTQANILRQYYEYGYTDGYNTGFDEGLYEGQNIQQYTNLVGYVEQLIGQFTGTSAAQYITPIAIVLVVLFVYFLFIRFLLSLVKAKGIIKTCDIIMIVACIIMLVVMYSPMLDFTIKTEQINSSEETTEAVQINRSNIYVETTETGDIYYGPVGTAIVTKSETIEDIYKISEDIETEAIAYEKD